MVKRSVVADENLKNPDDRLFDLLWVVSVRAETWGRVGRTWASFLLASALITSATASGSGIAAILKRIGFWGVLTGLAATVSWLTTAISALQREKGATEAHVGYLNLRTRLEVLREVFRQHDDKPKTMLDSLKEMHNEFGTLEMRHRVNMSYGWLEEVASLHAEEYLVGRGYATKTEAD